MIFDIILLIFVVIGAGLVGYLLHDNMKGDSE